MSPQPNALAVREAPESAQAAGTQPRRAAAAAAETAPLIAFTLPSTPYSVRLARFYVRAALSHHGLGRYADDAETVTAELAANAVNASTAADGTPRYANGAMPLLQVGLYRDGHGTLRLECWDAAPGVPAVRQAGPDAESGRGLAMVHGITAGHWGWYTLRTGKVVWAVIASAG